MISYYEIYDNNLVDEDETGGVVGTNQSATGGAAGDGVPTTFGVLQRVFFRVCSEEASGRPFRAKGPNMDPSRGGSTSMLEESGWKMGGK